MVFGDTVTVPIREGSPVQGQIAQGDYLLRNDIMVIRILQSSAGDRPIYFASTTGTFERFELQPWMIRQGTAFKFETGPVQPSPSLVACASRAEDRFRTGWTSSAHEG
jgi:hypothetical protein